MKKIGFILFLLTFSFNASAFDLTKGVQDLNNNIQKIEAKKANKKAEIEVKKADKKAEIEAKKLKTKEKIDAKKQKIENKKNEVKNKIEEKKKAISEVKNSLETTTSGCPCKNKKQ